MTRLIPNAVSEIASATSAASTHHQLRWASVCSDFSRMCSLVMMIAARPAAAMTATVILRHRVAVPPLLILIRRSSAWAGHLLIWAEETLLGGPAGRRGLPAGLVGSGLPGSRLAWAGPLRAGLVPGQVPGPRLGRCHPG